MKKYLSFFVLILFALIFHSCKSSSADSNNEDSSATQEVVTPVTITYPIHGNINQTVELNATSVFNLKTFVKSNAIGYLQTSGIQLGQYVSKGQTLFTIKTKEAVALGNTINSLDSSLHFDGVTRIKSPISGYVTQLNLYSRKLCSGWRTVS